RFFRIGRQVVAQLDNITVALLPIVEEREIIVDGVNARAHAPAYSQWAAKGHGKKVSILHGLVGFGFVQLCFRLRVGRNLFAFFRLVAVDQLLGEPHAFTSTRDNGLKRGTCCFADSRLTLAEGGNIHHGITSRNKRLDRIDRWGFAIGSARAEGNEEQGEPDPETAAKQKTHRVTSNIRRRGGSKLRTSLAKP